MQFHLPVPAALILSQLPRVTSWYSDGTSDGLYGKTPRTRHCSSSMQQYWMLAALHSHELCGAAC